MPFILMEKYLFSSLKSVSSVRVLQSSPGDGRCPRELGFLLHTAPARPQPRGHSDGDARKPSGAPERHGTLQDFTKGRSFLPT